MLVFGKGSIQWPSIYELCAPNSMHVLRERPLFFMNFFDFMLHYITSRASITVLH